MSVYGIILVDKPVGITSFDVIRKIRKITGIRKIGHTGTLDPFASGLLPVCIGKATRISSKLSSREKEYVVTMQFGIRTDTGDNTGSIIETKAIPKLTLANIKKIIPQILSIKEQVPHKFSAIKVNGKKAYELARANKQVELKPRPVKILSFEISELEFPYLTYRTKVSKGTYIRSLTETIAEKLNTIATTVKLRRTEIGNIKIESAISLNEIESTNWQDHMIPLNQFFRDMQKLVITETEYNHFQNGRSFKVDTEDIEEIMILNIEGSCLGFASIDGNLLKPRIVLI
jgi:tRNA pseudouridine55 synthase